MNEKEFQKLVWDTLRFFSTRQVPIPGIAAVMTTIIGLNFKFYPETKTPEAVQSLKLMLSAAIGEN